MRLSIALVAPLFFSSCYLSYTIDGEGDAGPSEAGPGSPDSMVVTPGPPDAMVTDPVDPPEPSLICPTDVATMIVGPEGGCQVMVIPSGPTTVMCDGIQSGVSGSTMLIHRERPGDWSVLIRATNSDSERICYGYVSQDSCEACRTQGCATGGDLSRSGIGGGLPDVSELRLMVDNQGEDMRVRICSPPI